MTSRSKPKWPPERVYVVLRKRGMGNEAHCISGTSRGEALHEARLWRTEGIYRVSVHEYRLVPKRKPAKKRKGVRRAR